MDLDSFELDERALAEAEQRREQKLAADEQNKNKSALEIYHG